MTYKVRLTETAKKELQRLPGNFRQRAKRLIDSLARQPRPAGARELRDLPGRFRLHLDGWRIIYRVDDEIGAVVLLRVRRKTGPETYGDLQ